MYHPGKVVEVLRPADKDVLAADGNVQAVLQMWDDEVLTFLVPPKLAGKIKAGQTALVDYGLDDSHKFPAPSHTVVKILAGPKAENVWKTYKELLARRKRQSEERQPAAPVQSYIG